MRMGRTEITRKLTYNRTTRRTCIIRVDYIIRLVYNNFNRRIIICYQNLMTIGVSADLFHHYLGLCNIF